MKRTTQCKSTGQAIRQKYMVEFTVDTQFFAGPWSDFDQALAYQRALQKKLKLKADCAPRIVEIIDPDQSLGLGTLLDRQVLVKA